ncbi:chaperone protein dnaJ 11, chloroplastic [Apium graveolens]|uniref:chaperone protein dnaJ 11, chloroplastic n=1 Tax=Apium graveolens TaxID=4045 RepID=UPI003D796BBE
MAGTLAVPSTTFLHFSGDTRFPPIGKFMPNSTTSHRRFRTTALQAVADPTPCISEIKRPASLYEILGLSKNASSVEIKSAYRSLAKLYHPDSSESSDGGDFIRIHKAYSTLSDPSARALYDLSLRAAAKMRERRRYEYAAAAAPASYRKGYYTTRRWETDQCW